MPGEFGAGFDAAQTAYDRAEPDEDDYDEDDPYADWDEDDWAAYYADKRYAEMKDEGLI